MAEAGKTSLYVGDLEPAVTDSVLFEAFAQTSQVSSVRVCRDLLTGRSLGYGYVTFDYPHDAKRAQEMMNFTAINGKEIRVMYYVHNPSLRKRGVGNIFIKNLEESIDHKALYETFLSFGSILRFKLATNNASGRSKGFAFVQYDNEESTLKAIDYMKGMLLNEKEVYIGPFLQKDSPYEKVVFTDVYVKNLSKSLTDQELNAIFREFGPTKSCVIIRDGDVPQGKSKGYGFVSFENFEDAENAVEALNGKKFENKEWFVTKSKRTYQRESELKRDLKKAISRSQGSNNLCVKNLPKSVTDQNLRNFFSSYGTITSCKVMRDSSGVSKGSGFVAFSKPEEASKAMEEINGEMKMRKQVYANLAVSLANETPEHQRTMLGENLYPMVEQLEPESAAKITGMILHMDKTKVLHLLESLVALESKVAEAIETLKTVKEQQQSGSVAESPAKYSVSDHLKESDKGVRDGPMDLRLSNPKLVRTVNQQAPTATIHSGALESANDSKSTLTPSFRSPKPSPIARVNKRLSTRERSAVLLTNRFDSLKGVGE